LDNTPATWMPTLKQPLLLKGNYQLTSRSQVNYHLVLVLHLASKGVAKTANPVIHVLEYLCGLMGDKVQFNKILFDFEADGGLGLEEHHLTMECLAAGLAVYVIFYLEVFIV
jgi:hypothetical protein